MSRRDPVRIVARTEQPLSVKDLPARLGRRRVGDYRVDAWGADPDWTDIASLLTPLLRVRVDGIDHLPPIGPALIVTNRRMGIGEPCALTIGLRRATGRLVRCAGVPDARVVSPILRRFGMVRSHPTELRGVLTEGNVVVVPLSGTLRREAGTVSPELLAPALELGVPVLPAATVGGELSGSWRVYLGSRVAPPSSVRRTPLAAAELADRARAGVQMLLADEFPSRLTERL